MNIDPAHQPGPSGSEAAPDFLRVVSSFKLISAICLPPFLIGYIAVYLSHRFVWFMLCMIISIKKTRKVTIL